MKFYKKLNWSNTLFLILTPVVGVVGTIYLAIQGAVLWQTVLLAFLYILCTGLSITAGYHRLYSHLSYKAKPVVRFFYLLFGAAAFEGSVLEWCTDHRAHHRYTDTDRDPYDIKKGFWYAHMGWLFTLDPAKRDYSNVDDLQADFWIALQHRYFVFLGFLIGFIAPAFIAAAWGDAWGGFIIAGALRTALNQQFTFCINSVCHLWGKRTYSEQQSAQDNWVTALFTYGEGFHNFHHQFPIDYRNGIRFFHYDPTKWLIKLLSYVGLAQDLKQVSDPKIIQYKVRMDEKRLLAKHSSESFAEYLKTSVHPVRDAILQISARIEELEKAYQEFKHQGVESMLEGYRQRLEEHRHRLQQARVELKQFMLQWSELIRHSHRLSAFSQ